MIQDRNQAELHENIQVLRPYLESALQEQIQTENLPEYLSNGVALCRVLNHIRPKTPIEFKANPNAFSR